MTKVVTDRLVLKPASDNLKFDILCWHNADPERATMIMQDIIAADSHIAWWERVKSDRTKRILVLSRRADQWA